jgi:ABC-2 type transport system ATP-binding protein
VVLTTHYMEEAEQLCDRIAIMDHGRVVDCDTPRALINDLRADATVRAAVEGGGLPPAMLEALTGVVATEIETGDGGDTIALRTTDAQATLIALLELAREQRVTLTGLETTQATLEDVFLARTGHRYEGDG